MSVDGSIFEDAYRDGTAPWVIGEPQPAVVALHGAGRIRGRVLDPGCGTGDNALYLAGSGHDVVAVDQVGAAVAQARAATERAGVRVAFDVADVFEAQWDREFDTVVDSALFHVFGPGDAARYTDVLHRACRPGASVFVLALSDEGPGYGPVISAQAIRDAFGDGWTVESVERTEYRGVVDEDEDGKGRVLDDLPAWLAHATRDPSRT